MQIQPLHLQALQLVVVVKRKARQHYLFSDQLAYVQAVGTCTLRGGWRGISRRLPRSGRLEVGAALDDRDDEVDAVDRAEDVFVVVQRRIHFVQAVHVCREVICRVDVLEGT